MKKLLLILLLSAGSAFAQKINLPTQTQGILPVANGGTGNANGSATQLLGGTWAVPGAIGSTIPSTGVFSGLTLIGSGTWANITTATSGTTNASPSQNFSANYWTGAASAVDNWSIQNTLAAGTNGISYLAFTHTGSTSPFNAVSVPSLYGPGAPGNWTIGSQAGGALSFAGSIIATGSARFNSGVYLQASGAQILYYNNIPTVSNGVPSEYATVDLTAQSAAKAATTLYAATITGMYRACWSADITTAATTSSVLGGSNGFQILYTSPTDSLVKTTTVDASTTSAANTTGTAVGGCKTVYAKTGTNIQYQFDYTSVGGTAMVYELHVKAEAL